MILNINEIKKILPHSYPFLLVDRILEIGDGSIKGLKNVTYNEPFFIGHFPSKPIMPGVLMVEAMAQVGGIMLLKDVEAEAKALYFMSIDNVKFRKPVIPGDQLIIDLQTIKRKGSICKMHGEIFVDGKIVAQADLMATIADKDA